MVEEATPELLGAAAHPLPGVCWRLKQGKNPAVKDAESLARSLEVPWGRREEKGPSPKSLRISR